MCASGEPRGGALGAWRCLALDLCVPRGSPHRHRKPVGSTGRPRPSRRCTEWRPWLRSGVVLLCLLLARCGDRSGRGQQVESTVIGVWASAGYERLGAPEGQGDAPMGLRATWQLELFGDGSYELECPQFAEVETGRWSRDGDSVVFERAEAEPALRFLGRSRGRVRRGELVFQAWGLVQFDHELTLSRSDRKRLR